jgi:hypothetical protein
MPFLFERRSALSRKVRRLIGYLQGVASGQTVLSGLNGVWQTDRSCQFRDKICQLPSSRHSQCEPGNLFTNNVPPIENKGNLRKKGSHWVRHFESWLQKCE